MEVLDPDEVRDLLPDQGMAMIRLKNMITGSARKAMIDQIRETIAFTPRYRVQRVVGAEWNSPHPFAVLITQEIDAILRADGRMA
jgi:hypothetical protein